MANHLGNIQCIVTLMLENRSFDHMLGFLYAKSGNKSPLGQTFEGLKASESNPDDAGREVAVFKIEPSSPHPYLMPAANPGEGFHNTNQQLFGKRHVAPSDKASNRGFVVNFKDAIAYDRSRGYKDTLPDAVPSDVMGMYTPETLPVMSALARGYAVCDGYFASVPTQTIANRAFAGAGTSQGHLSNFTKVFTCPSIYGRLSDKKLDWSIFGYSRPSMTRTDFPDTTYADPSHFGQFPQFQQRAADGTLASYTFLEPDMSTGGNSQHPNDDVAAGEQLILDVYQALRRGKNWNNTLLIITYDEHGGNFDHVPPPSNAVPPDTSVAEYDNFDFKRYGVRIPAVLVSPLIKAGTVLRPTNGPLPFDHTSILKTIELRWDLQPLTKRDAAAPDFGDVLTEAAPRKDDPLDGVTAPVSSAVHPNLSQPSELLQLHAERVSALPLPGARGQFGHSKPNLVTTADYHDYIASRNAQWDDYLRQHPTLIRG
jgi:phospholipase C